MDLLLKEGECLDDLQIKGYKIIQDRTKFCFGMDAVLLSNFVKVKPGDRVVDLGTGTGIIPILMAAKTGASTITGIEIQEDMVEMAQRSVILNMLEDRISIVHGDLRTDLNWLGRARWDVVVSNPPYKKLGSGFINPKDSKAIARHEVMCTLDDVLSAASNLLKFGGKFAMVHRPDRFMDIVTGMRNVRLEPKRIRLVHPTFGKSPNLMLIEGVLGGKPHLKWLPPLYVYDECGAYTEEILHIYGLKGDDGDGPR